MRVVDTSVHILSEQYAVEAAYEPKYFAKETGNVAASVVKNRVGKISWPGLVS